MITSFPSKWLYNPGGLRHFKFMPAYQVINQPLIRDSEITEPFTFSPGLSWLDGYATAETLNFNEPGTDSENGTIYDPEISGFVPGDKLDLIRLMSKMDRQPFLVLITDALGQLRVCGSHGYPLTFLSSFNSGTGRADSKGFQFSFKTQCIFRAPVYNV